MNFGENLKHLRKMKKLSQEVLAEKVGVSRQSVSKWENGEAYPEMSNILALCSIFHCKINDLVNDNITDLNSLDDEIKMSIVKFKEEEQKKMKGLSKAIYVIARIFKVISIIGLVGTLIGLIASIVVIPNMEFDLENERIEIFNKKFDYVIDDIKFEIKYDDEKFLVEHSNLPVVQKIMTANKFYQVSFAIILFVSGGFFMIALFKAFTYLEKLFLNIHNEDTPFNMFNVSYIKKIAIYLILSIIIPDVIGTISGLAYGLDLDISIEVMDIVFILIIFALSYIFKYGYEIQLDSKGKIYGAENE